MSNKLFIIIIALVLFFNFNVPAQTSAFIYQGKLNDGAIPANGIYQFTFRLYDAVSNGNQVGQTISDLPATVTNGIFAVSLDFGASGFDGGARYLEIGVRLNNSGQIYTMLTPRQPVTSTPYAVKSLNANSATTAATANDAIKLGGVPASQYTKTDDARLSDARPPTAFSTYYIQNGTTPQATSNFNISGEGKASTMTATQQFNIGANRVLTSVNGNLYVGAESGAANGSGAFGTFVGSFAGQKNTTGIYNSFFGYNAGQNNLDGRRNSFFGVNSGLGNTSGSENSFFGLETGYVNTTGNSNAFFGTFAGKSNTEGSLNSFFGRSAGQSNQTGIQNSFFGRDAGFSTTTGGDNTFVGASSGFTNTTGKGNSFFGFLAGRYAETGSNNTFVGTNAGANTISGSNNTYLGYNAQGAPDITNAAAIGSNAVVTTSDTMVLGTNAVTVQVPGNLTVANTFSASALNSATVYKINNNRVFHLTGTNNTAVGFEAGNSLTTGGNNAFFGSYSGRDNKTGIGNSFFGSNAGLSNNSGSYNAFFGSGAGLSNFSGTNNSYFGTDAGSANSTGDNNSFFGRNAGKAVDNVSFNSFFGSFSGEKTTTGAGNTFVGAFAGRENLIGFNNTVIGYKAAQTPTTGNSNVAVGYNASFGEGVSNSVAIGANVSVAASNRVVIGKSSDSVFLGNVDTTSLNSGPLISTTIQALELNVDHQIKTSSVKASSNIEAVDFIATGQDSSFEKATVKQFYATSANIRTNLIANVFYFRQFSPSVGVEALCWNSVGLVYELAKCPADLAKPQAAMTAAVQKQQAQIEAQAAENKNLQDRIERQQTQIDELKSLVCATNKEAAVCRSDK